MILFGLSFLLRNSSCYCHHYHQFVVKRIIFLACEKWPGLVFLIWTNKARNSLAVELWSRSWTRNSWGQIADSTNSCEIAKTIWVAASRETSRRNIKLNHQIERPVDRLPWLYWTLACWMEYHWIWSNQWSYQLWIFGWIFKGTNLETTRFQQRTADSSSERLEVNDDSENSELWRLWHVHRNVFLRFSEYVFLQFSSMPSGPQVMITMNWGPPAGHLSLFESIWVGTKNWDAE